MDRPRLSAVIVSHNTRDLVLKAIGSVVECGDSSLEVIVVDNASEDGSVDAVRRTFPEARVISNSNNLGFGRACNQAIDVIESEYILLLNSDAQLTADGLGAMVGCMESTPRCGAASCAIDTSGGQTAATARNFLTPFNQALEHLGVSTRWQSRRLRRTCLIDTDSGGCDCTVDWVEASCVLLRHSALAEVGLFDERFFMYSEDEDLCYRLRAAGWLVCYTNAASVFHVGGASSVRYGVGMLRQFYLSQMRFLHKHHGRTSVFFYSIGMTLVLLLKRLWPGGNVAANRRQQARDRLRAFRMARSGWRRS
jgi:GT2 family glycosyltransferase